MVRTKSVWVSWRPAKRRFEVGFRWEGELFQFYSWEIRVGKRIPLKTREIADEYANHIRTLMRPNAQGIITFDPWQLKGRRRSPWTFRKYVRTWLDEYGLQAEVGDRSAEYVEALERYNRLYWGPGLAELDIREVNEPVIKRFYLDLAKRGLSRKYVQNIMDGLRKLVLEACESSRLVEPKFPDYKEKKRREVVDWLLEDDQDRAIERVPPADRPIVKILFYHGLRQSEARFLTWDCVDLNRGTAKIETLKGGPVRVILLEPDLLEDIKRIPRTLKHRYVFHRAGRPYAKTTLWKIIRRALDEADLKTTTPTEASRHSAGTQMLRRGASTRLVQKVLGHADIRTTERYVHALVEDQASVRRNTKNGKKISILDGCEKP
jgi:integrase